MINDQGKFPVKYVSFGLFSCAQNNLSNIMSFAYQYLGNLYLRSLAHGHAWFELSPCLGPSVEVRQIKVARERAVAKKTRQTCFHHTPN